MTVAIYCFYMQQTKRHTPCLQQIEVSLHSTEIEYQEIFEIWRTAIFLTDADLL